MKTRIAVANQKGGVGKTTTAVNLAASLAGRGYRTLLLDLDPQGNATTSLGFAPAAVQDAAYMLLQAAGTPPPPLSTGVAELYLIGGSLNLAGLDVELAAEAQRPHRLRTALAASGWDDYDFLIADCPPSLGLLTVNALVACESVLVPLQCEFFALDGLAQLTRTVSAVRKAYNPSLSLLGILLTMYDRRNNLSDLVASDVRGFFGDVVLQTIIPRNVRLSEAPSHGLPIGAYDARSPGALAYERLSEELMARISSRAAEHA